MKTSKSFKYLTLMTVLGGFYLLSGCGFKTDPANESASTGFQTLGFQGASNLESGTGMSTTPQIVVEPDGSATAMAVWIKLVDLDPFDTLPAVNHLFARRAIGTSNPWVTSDTGCTDSITDIYNISGNGTCVIDTGSKQYGAWAPKISMDDNGNAIVVWEQFDGTAQRVYARRFASGVWGTIQTLNDSSEFTLFNASAPAIAVEPDPTNNGGGDDSSDSAMAVWSQYYQTDWTQTLNGDSIATYDSVRSMTVLDGILYAGMGDGADGDGDILAYNSGGGSNSSGLNTWVRILDNGLSTNTFCGTGCPYDQADSMAAYNHKLYVGFGDSAAGDGDVGSYDPTTNTWTKVFDTGIPAANTGQYESVRSMAVYNGQLYIGLGTGTGDADIYRCSLCDGTDWTQVADAVTNAYEAVTAMVVYNSKLYIGLGSSTTGDTDGDVLVCTTCGGSDWTTALNNTTTYDAVRSMAVHNSKLYVGLGDNAGGDGDVVECNPARVDNEGGAGTTDDVSCVNGGAGITGDWATVFADLSTYEAVTSMVAYNGFLYIGLGTSLDGDGDIKRCALCDNTDWVNVRDDTVTYQAVFSLTVYDAELYAGMGSSASVDGDVLKFSAGWQTMARRFSSGVWATSDTGVCPTNSGKSDGICFISGGASVTPSGSPVVAMDASGKAITAFIRQEASTCILAPTADTLDNLNTFTCYDTSLYVNMFDNVTPLSPNWGGVNGAFSIDPDAPVVTNPFCYNTNTNAIGGSTTACVSAAQPKIAMDRNGNAIVVAKVYWREEENIHTTPNCSGCGGSSASHNNPPDGSAEDDWSGNAIAAIRFPSGSSWAAGSWTNTFLFAHTNQLSGAADAGGTDQFFNCPPEGRVQTESNIWLVQCRLDNPQIAMAGGDATNSPFGLALAVFERFWKDASGSYSDVYADCFSLAGSPCGTTQVPNLPVACNDTTINPNNGWRSVSCNGAAPQGNGFITPPVTTATNNNWTFPYAVLNDTGVSRTAYAPQVALDSTGNGMAVWAQKDASGRWRVYGMRFKAGTGFDTATQTTIDNYTAGDYYYGNPVIAMEWQNTGNAANCPGGVNCGNAWTLFLESELTPGSVLPALNIRVRGNQWMCQSGAGNC